MAAAFSSLPTVEKTLNRLASLLPMAEKSDLTPLVDIQKELNALAERNDLPKALRNMAKRGAQLAEHTIMEETPFDTGCKKLGECIEKMTKSVGGSPAAGKGDESNAGENFEKSAGEESAVEIDDLLVKFAAQLKPALEDFEATALEHEKGNPNALGAIKRALHTWKGEFGVLGLQEYSGLIHRIEEALENGSFTTDNLLRLEDFLSGRADSFAAGKAPRISPMEERGLFEQASENVKKRPDSAPQPASQPATPRPQKVPTSGEKAFTGDPSLMGDFITESRDHTHQAEMFLLDLESDPTNAEKLNSIFRSWHTIKGVAGFLGLTEVGELAHSMENLMDSARKGDVILGPAQIDLLLEGNDCLKQFIAMVEEMIKGAKYRTPEPYHSLMERLASPLTIEKIDVLPAAGKKVGEILVDAGVAARETVETALRLQQEGDERKLGQILVEEANVPARIVAGALAAQNASKQSAAVEETIRVPVSRLDQLIDMIGEAVIAQSMIAADPVVASSRSQALDRKISQTGLIMRQIQEMSMSLRMVSLKLTFQKMARLARDLSKKSGKTVEFVMEGEDTELDKSVVENIGDPLIHMIRNAVDHGVEDSPDDRVKAGKPAAAKVCLRAFHRAGNIYIEIADDGRGLDKEAIFAKAVKQGLCKAEDKLSDREIYQFIFMPGFSTAKKVTDVSGRGVGMDVVRRNIQALRGSVDIQTELGKGTTFSIRLPLTLAIIDGMVVRLNDAQYIIPTLSIVESLKPDASQIQKVLDRGEILKVRGELIPFIRLAHVFNPKANGHGEISGIVVIVEDMIGKRTGLLVDEIVGQQQVVIKSLGSGLGEVPGVSGGAIMSDGNVSLILDIGGIVKMAGE